ncbi:MAG: DUF1232 domain-containing protein [Ardenticatenaceae bacterium]|nr:DUF1232 domain-containing protein [Ardenticatenaceae bacterium]
MLLSLRVLPNLVNPHYWKKIWTEIKLVGQLMKDGRVPIYAKVLPVVVGLYLLSPFDLIPGFLPVIGQLDDFGLLLMGLSTFIRLAPAEVIEEYTPRDVEIQAKLNK